VFDEELWEWLLREALVGGLITNMLLRLRSEQADSCLRHRAWHCGADALNVSEGSEGWWSADPGLESEGADICVFGRQAVVKMANLGSGQFQA
jgi:hypothetical protein